MMVMRSYLHRPGCQLPPLLLGLHVACEDIYDAAKYGRAEQRMTTPTD